jgi:Carbohydrate-binding module 48 (Isoamylase N-terminal domain)
VDVGGMALRYADSLNATAAAVTPDFRFESRRANAEAVGTFSQFISGGWSSQGTLSSSLFPAQVGPLLLEVSGFGGGSYHHDGTRTGEAIANARAHFSGDRSGVFGGGGIGTTWNVGGWRRFLLGEIGAWARNAAGNAVVTLSPVSVDDTTRYVDGQVSFETARERFDFSAVGGYRWGSHLPVDLSGAKSWASFSATGWLTPVWGIVAAAGTYPVDPTQGFPGGRFVSLGVRLASARRAAPILQNYDLKAPPESAVAESAPASSVFRIVRDAQGHNAFRFYAPEATRVEMSGDFTQWAPISLQRSTDGWWSGEVPKAAGTYQMNVRVDGGQWMVPSGMLSMKDEFGGVTGLLVIE